MPQRLNTRTVPSDAVQGDDSWVKLRRMTVEEFEAHNKRVNGARKANAENNTEEGERIEAETRQFFADVLLDWNWVDDDGQALPKPRDNPAVLARLTLDELEFITGVIMFGGSEKKATTSSTPKS